MYRLREMDVDDKVCEQVEMGLLEKVYPKEVIIRCVEESQPWSSKARRVRKSTVLALVLFVIGMGLWSRLNQSHVWQKLVGKLSDLHPEEPDSQLSDSALSGRRQVLGKECLQALMHTRCVLLANKEEMPGAFFGRYRLMAIDGSVFNVPDTPANDQAFGRSSNQYGKGAYPQVRTVLLVEYGSHAVVRLEVDGYDVSEVHGAHRLISHIGPDMLLMMDAGLTSGSTLEEVRQRKAHALAALEAGAWENVPGQRRLSFTHGLFQLTEMMDLALILEPDFALDPLHHRLLHKIALHILPPRSLRINRREVKQIYGKYKPKKRDLPPPEPFDPDDQFLDFVELLDPLPTLK